jgi:uncharacterized membrane protein YedE/YeeE
MFNLTPWASLAGGVLIGLACAGLWLLGGRLAGISGIASGLVEPLAAAALGQPGDRAPLSWRAWFLAGLLAGGAIWAWREPTAFAYTLDRSAIALAGAGLLVGVGTRLGGGCTSGHGVCGIGRRGGGGGRPRPRQLAKPAAGALGGEAGPGARGC